LIHSDLTIKKIQNVYKRIKPYIKTTPFITASNQINNYFGTNLFFKCEFMQNSSSFKIRGAINNILSINKEKIKRGITAVSAGNHAIASSYVANLFNLKNKIFLYESANDYRLNICRKYKANLFLTNPHRAFKDVESAEKEGYYFIHPFDGKHTLQGNATLGLEIINQISNLNIKIDNVIISVGGGGLVSGIGSYIKQILPNINIFGVEPIGAQGLNESLKKGFPLNKIKVNSIADSLCAPLHMQYSFDVAKQVIDKIVTVTDKQMVECMLYAYNNLKFFLEPACVAGLAALKNSLYGKLHDQNTLLILCGSSIDVNTWNKIVKY
tara:strand:+ start:1392 stop:2366 length:975 start_codon:yes stop_codon:yes gene_type:complete